MSAWEQGYLQGRVDGQVITQPIKTNGHTFDLYVSVKYRYANGLHPWADAWHQGYALGLDDVATEHGYTATEDDVEAFYDSL